MPARIKVTPFTYAGVEVVALRDITLPMSGRVIPAGTKGRIVHAGGLKECPTWAVQWPGESMKRSTPADAVQLLTGYEQYWAKQQGAA